ncbi:MAG: hypothetical protein VXA34_09365 [Gammaproteobacteria bacterium]
MSNKSQLAKAPKDGEDRAKLAKFKKGLLSNSMTPKVIQKALDIAMDDDHPGQIQALRMVWDRVLPQSSFSASASSGNQGAIQINFTGLTAAPEVKDVTPEPEPAPTPEPPADRDPWLTDSHYTKQ